MNPEPRATALMASCSFEKMSKKFELDDDVTDDDDDADDDDEATTKSM